MLKFPHHWVIVSAAISIAAAGTSIARDVDVTVSPELRRFMLSMPYPTYPLEARTKRITGRGKCELVIDLPTGVVTRVFVIESTGSKLLDEAPAKAFLRWRVRPGLFKRMRVPFTFYL